MEHLRCWVHSCRGPALAACSLQDAGASGMPSLLSCGASPFLWFSCWFPGETAGATRCQLGTVQPAGVPKAAGAELWCCGLRHWGGPALQYCQCDLCASLAGSV